jgi:hypothetical protein
VGANSWVQWVGVGFRCATLTSGIRAEVQKKPRKTSRGSHGERGIREHLLYMEAGRVLPQTRWVNPHRKPATQPTNSERVYATNLQCPMAPQSPQHSVVRGVGGAPPRSAGRVVVPLRPLPSCAASTLATFHHPLSLLGCPS